MEGFDPGYSIVLLALCSFLGLVAVVKHYAPRTPLPAESWLLVAGIVYGLLVPLTNVLPAVSLAPELVIGLILPVLIFSAGRTLRVGLLLRSSGPIATLVLLGIPLSITVIGLPVAWLLDIPWSHGLMIGAAVAATDPTSVSRVVERFPVPERLKLLLHGESIFNDSITIVLFTALAGVLIADQTFSIIGIGVNATRSMLLAVPVGLLLGWLAGLLVRRWGEQNRMPGLTLTLALAIAAFLLSEQILHASGIIAVLCAALAFSHTRQYPELAELPPRHESGHEAGTASSSRQLYHDLWEYLGSLGASVLYFALGTLIATEVPDLHWALAAVPLLFLASRAVMIYGSGPLLRLGGESLPAPWRHILMLGGLRGAVPAALVLMTPVDYLYRDALLLVVFTVVSYSIIIHPLLIQWYLHKNSLSDIADRSEQDGSTEIDHLPRLLQRALAGTEWGLAALAGLIAGIVFLIMEMVMLPVIQDVSLWVPVRMIAAIGLGPGVLPPPASFALDVALIAMVVHFTLSLVYAWILAPIVEGRTKLKALLGGLAFGMALYLINFYLFTVMFPWFANARNWISIFAHLVFGGVLAGSYVLLRRYSAASS